MTTIQTQRPTLVYVACFYPDLIAFTGLLLWLWHINRDAEHGLRSSRALVCVVVALVVHQREYQPIIFHLGSSGAVDFIHFIHAFEAQQDGAVGLRAAIQ